MSPRRRITAALVGLLLLVLAVWAVERVAGDSASSPELVSGTGCSDRPCHLRATGQ